MMSSDSNTYIGNELDLFSEANRWKYYWIHKVNSEIKHSVLEVGAGIGGTTFPLLEYCSGIDNILALEPDPYLANQIISTLPEANREKVKVKTGKISDLETDQAYDSILYIDVIEHIEDDKGELERAAKLLNKDGAIIVLVPAHQYLYSEFDKNIGHFRRYNKRTLREIIPDELQVHRMMYLDSAGLMASLFNRYIFKKAMPNRKQIRFWDSILVSISKASDWILSYRVGKSLVAVLKNKQIDRDVR